MDDRDVRRYWEANAEGWTVMSRQGYDRCRDLFNTPTFLRLLPEVRGLRGLDLGCGEGHNTRLLAGRGARMIALDIAPTFIRYAREAEQAEPLGIDYLEASASWLPFKDGQFDFVAAFMSMQDIPDQERAVAEAFRVLRPGGFFQFSIIHPCFQTPKFGWIRDEAGRKVAATVGDYFRPNRCRIDEWSFGAAPEELRKQYPKFKTPYFERPLSSWLNMLLDAGFLLEAFAEPTVDDETLAQHPGEYDARLIAYFLIVRCRRPERVSDR
jgi:ubiquinone/menaquinone biosynthesis C-methylase UbiE